MINKAKFVTWIHDFIVLFHNFISVKFKSRILISDNTLGKGFTRFVTNIDYKLSEELSALSNSTITITEKGITEFEYFSDNSKIKARCIKY